MPSVDQGVFSSDPEVMEGDNDNAVHKVHIL